ncbi:type VI secretion system tip protein VgrG [Shewanella surugensis]|uniref:Type VI secretion system tip protein VgrG n=1 Tax=Shewanella surugensis TaxID=212020 RepID=A0ABT0L865_9GAMM|nr:type VI secretion system tip protein VgrG [Shewanella surugensis]MCL1123744.1 type VI secretion system tip protein VgrG [Shewanella surugensis]
MAASPLANSDGVLSYSITTNGAPLKDTVNVLSIEVSKMINQISKAKIVIEDGDMPTKDFIISNQDDFKPGAEIVIKAGYAGSLSQIYSGIVIRHGISIGQQNDSRLVVECRDKAVAMTLGRKSNNYVDQKDSDIISTLIGQSSGLSADVTATTTEYPELVQFNCTDWDFLLVRAEVNGFVVCVDDGKVSVNAPKVSSSAVLTVTYGEDLIRFNADIDARYQFKSVTGISWDSKNQASIEAEVSAQTLNSQGDLTTDDLAEALNLSEYRLQTSSALAQSALKDWATGQQVKSGLSRIRGNMAFQGNDQVMIGSLVEVAGVGNRFNGDVFVSQVHHELSNGQWLTEVEFGMSPNWSAEHRDLAPPAASGLIPGIEGLHIGVVLKLDEDPAQQNRIQVQVPVAQAQTQGVWARLSTYYASEGFGNFFIPEIGDEVVLGYFNQDPSEPVILGSLYSSQRSPPDELSAENNIKAIVTKSLLKIEFDDENKVITVITPGNNKIILSDKDESILLQDQNNNKVELSSSGISLESPKDIKISAQGTLSLESEGKMSLSSNADLSASGLNVNMEAQVGFTGKGSATAELSASGQTTVKGAIVMIN